MSTKVYNGLILKNKTIHSVFPYLKSMKKNIVNETIEKIKSNIIGNYIFSLDEQFHFKLEEKKHLKNLFSYFEFLNEISYFLQFHSEIILIPHNNKIYALYYNDELLKPLKEIGFEDYYYQDQTDKPDNISEEDWSQREKDWNNIFRESSIPSEIGLSFLFLNDCKIKDDLNFDILFSPASFNKYIPTKEKRIENIAIGIAEKKLKENDFPIYELAKKSKEEYLNYINEATILDSFSF